MLPAGNHEISCADMRRQSGCWLRIEVADSVGEALQQEPGRQGDVPLARQRCQMGSRCSRPLHRRVRCSCALRCDTREPVVTRALLPLSGSHTSLAQRALEPSRKEN